MFSLLKIIICDYQGKKKRRFLSQERADIEAKQRYKDCWRTNSFGFEDNHKRQQGKQAAQQVRSARNPDDCL